jgi:hypothetical protein
VAASATAILNDIIFSVFASVAPARGHQIFRKARQNADFGPRIFSRAR